MNAVMTQELYSIRIGVGMLEHEADVLSFTEMNSSRATVEEENTSFQNLVSRTGSLVDAAAERVEIIQNEDKLLERNFKRDLQLEHQPDQESFKIILAPQSSCGGDIGLLNDWFRLSCSWCDRTRRTKDQARESIPPPQL